jgi:hypothetical protein
MEGNAMHAWQMTLKRVMLIGSGPIVIGQAAEFDYAGTRPAAR